MAPSPEYDNTPKAPDKNDKTKGETSTLESETTTTGASASTSDNKEASVSRLDDVELKALLDEAINYKIPKDRVGKSKLFQNLLEKAEEDDRKARATSASGSESVRYYNTTASHRRHRRREASSISENLTHGGSLNNLAKEELYAAACHRPPKTVSARQRQGGSLPCNVNAGITPSYDKQFFEDARRKTEDKKLEYTTIDMESDSLLEYDSLDQEFNEQPEIEVVQTRIPRLPVKYTSKLNLEIGGNNGAASVDDTVTVSALERSADKFEGYSLKPVEVIASGGHYQPPSHYNLNMPSWPFTKKSVEDRRVDENGNALGQGSIDAKKNKKKKVQTDKNVVVVEASSVVGHRYDIINDLDKLVEYIDGGEDEQNNTGSTRTKSNISNKTKMHKQQQHFGSTNGDDKSNANRKQKARCKSKSEKIHKCNSLEEISVSKLDDFTFSVDSDKGKIPLRSTKSNADRQRERRSWGNSESLPLHASAENLETADFRVVTKKKKSKKVRTNQRPQLTSNDFNRASSPEPRRKSASSVPHSDKSNDSSDVDSVHSLPIEHIGIDEDNANLPISYAEIAKTSNSFENRPKWNRLPSERRTKSVDKCVSVDSSIETVVQTPAAPTVVKTKSVNTQTQTLPKLQQTTCDTTPIVENVHWPAIADNQNSNSIKSALPPNVLNKNNRKNVKNDVNATLHALQTSEQNRCLSNNVQILPHNIPDVQTIEKLHFKQLQQRMQISQLSNNHHHQHRFVPQEIISNHTHYQPISVNNNPILSHTDNSSSSDINNMSPQYIKEQFHHIPIVENCDSDRTSSRPAVVILSGGGNKEVPGLTFGFEINEQLLSDDACDIFTSRFIVPNIFHHHNHDKIVNFIGLAWEDIINQTNSRVKYYNEKL